MEAFSVPLAFCERNPLVSGGFFLQRPVTRSFDIFMCSWTNGWANNRNAGDLRRQCVHYDVSIMGKNKSIMKRVFFYSHTFGERCISNRGPRGSLPWWRMGHSMWRLVGVVTNYFNYSIIRILICEFRPGIICKNLQLLLNVMVHRISFMEYTIGHLALKSYIWTHCKVQCDCCKFFCRYG